MITEIEYKKALKNRRENNKIVREYKLQQTEENEGLFWVSSVKTWFEFYSLNHDGNDPTFTRQNPSILKEILLNIKRRTEKKGYLWTEPHAQAILLQFFQIAYENPFLRSRFTLQLINLNFDIIISSYGKPTVSNTIRETGANASLQGSLNAINSYFSNGK